MYRVVDEGNEVVIGFDNEDQCRDYWKYLGLARIDDCFMYTCPIIEGDRSDYDLEFGLFELDYVSPNLNCEASIKVPRKVYQSMKSKLGDLGSYPCTQYLVTIANNERYKHMPV